MEINKLIDSLCESNFDMKKSYDNYFKKVEEIASYFSEEQAEKNETIRNGLKYMRENRFIWNEK